MAVAKARPAPPHPIPSLAHPAQFLTRCPSLHSLDLSSSSVAAADLSSASLAALNLSSCKRLSEALFARLPAGCPRLSRVELRDCDSLTDEVLRHLSRCPSLQHVDVSRCALITDTGVATLVKHAASLQHLDISWCPLLTERTLDFISACLRGVPYEAGAAAAAASSARSPLLLSASRTVARIRCLKVFGCASMRAEVVDAFRARFPHVEFRYAIAPRDWATLESI